jgi:anti-sigma regulatory factor (Ser/Thr protein kinase)
LRGLAPGKTPAVPTAAAERRDAAPAEPVEMSLRVPARLESLPEVRGALGTALRTWEDGRPQEVVLAVIEAVGNAIEHGSRPGEPVEVDIAVTPVDARVRVADTGRPGAELPSTPVVEPPPESTRGRGRLIMDRLADRLEVGRVRGGTEVVLHFSST